MSKIITRKLLSVLMIIAMVITLISVSGVTSTAASGKYWIKINKKTCVVTVYRKKSGKKSAKWKPIRAMRCCCGKKKSPTPSGTWTLKSRYRWVHMITDGWHSYEQYTTRFWNQYYLHSCCYHQPKKSQEITTQFNALGKHKTHGCIRLCVMDAKWIYENCPAGTKVTIFSSKKKGPLGKPKKLRNKSKKKYSWDPTDPDKKNPNFHMRKPQFTIKKSTAVRYGKRYKLKKGVKVQNTNANQDITNLLQIRKLTRDGKKVKISSFSTRKPGKYTIYYYVKDKYEIKKGKKGVTRKFTFNVVDKTVINGAGNKIVRINTVNAVNGVTAKADSGNLTGRLKVKITNPAGKTITLPFAKAKTYKFNMFGAYKVIYSVYNSKSKKTVARAVTFKTTKKVPNYTGQTYKKASAAVKSIGFEVVRKNINTKNSKLNGIVKVQSPKAGTWNVKGTKIILNVYKYTAPGKKSKATTKTKKKSKGKGKATAKKKA